MKITKQFFRFLIIGFISTGLNFVVYNFLFLINLNIIICSIIGYFTGIINSYWFGKKWVFMNSSSKNYNLIAKFVVVYFLGGLIMTIIVYQLNRLNFEYRISWFLGLCISLLNNFLGSKFFVFKKESNKY